MRSLAFLLFAAIAYASMARSEAGPKPSSSMFCDYVADFAPQIARNRIRQVPFLRLDEFNYFDAARSQFLRRTAQDIYSRRSEDLRRSLDDLGDTYAKECHNEFGRD